MIKYLTCCGMKTNGFGPKVVVDVSTVSLLGKWNTELGPKSASRLTPEHSKGRNKVKAQILTVYQYNRS